MAIDLLIKNGTLIDGTGAPARHGDIAVSGGRIVDIGKVGGSATRVIDAEDLVVAPGFVDPHTHTTRRSAGTRQSRHRPGMGSPP